MGKRKQSLDKLKPPRFSKFCQLCGKEQSYTTKAELNRATKINTVCRICHAKRAVAHKGNYKEIPITWFEEKKRRSTIRKREWDITIEYVWKIYLKQNRCCALSGLSLDFDKDTLQAMVSIDRINNDKGYIRRNIQLLHKTVNFMKYVYTQKEFIEMCKLVAYKNTDEKVS